MSPEQGPPPLIVLDTSVVISALLGGDEATSYLLLKEAGAGSLRVAASSAFVEELLDVVRRRSLAIATRRPADAPARAFELATDIWLEGGLVVPDSYPWSAVPDQEDWWLLDLAYETGADYIVTWNMGHLGPASSLGFEVVKPPEVLRKLGRI